MHSRFPDARYSYTGKSRRRMPEPLAAEEAQQAILRALGEREYWTGQRMSRGLGLDSMEWLIGNAR